MQALSSGIGSNAGIRDAVPRHPRHLRRLSARLGTNGVNERTTARRERHRERGGGSGGTFAVHTSQVDTYVCGANKRITSRSKRKKELRKKGKLYIWQNFGQHERSLGGREGVMRGRSPDNAAPQPTKPSLSRTPKCPRCKVPCLLTLSLPTCLPALPTYMVSCLTIPRVRALPGLSNFLLGSHADGHGNYDDFGDGKLRASFKPDRLPVCGPMALLISHCPPLSSRS